MKLKYKLFISYLLLISFFSIALLLIVLQTKAIDRFVRLRIEQDVQEVIDLSHQQQILEDVYAQYILTRLPGPSKNRYHESCRKNKTRKGRNEDHEAPYRRSGHRSLQIVADELFILERIERSAYRINPELAAQLVPDLRKCSLEIAGQCFASRRVDLGTGRGDNDE